MSPVPASAARRAMRPGLSPIGIGRPAHAAWGRSLRVAAAAALVCLTALGGALAQAVELDSRVFDIARQLRCPVCTSESVADSSVELAQQMRQIIKEQLDEGRSESEILAFFRERYGDWILLDPPKRGIHLVVWLLAAAAVAGGVAALVLVGRRWVGRSREPVEVDATDLARVRAELEGLSSAPGDPGVGRPGAGREGRGP